MSHKVIWDPIHKFIKVNPFIKIFIEYPEFQRMRYIKQLQNCYMVYPSAHHSRLEHSLGVMHLCNHYVDILREDPNSYITDRQKDIIALGGLYHDIGHGPYSHLYDLISECFNDDFHEMRGIQMIKNMMHKYSIDFSKEEEIFLLDLIMPPDQINDNQSDDNYLYQIVANSLNGIDVDKLDYLSRDLFYIGETGANFNYILNNSKVIDSNICYKEKCDIQLTKVFINRYFLYKTVYFHRNLFTYNYVIFKVIYDTYKKLRFDEITDNDIYYLLKNDEKYKSLYSRFDVRYTFKYIGEIRVNEKYKLKQFMTDLGYDVSFECAKFIENDIIAIDKVNFNMLNNKTSYDNIKLYSEYDSSLQSLKDISSLKLICDSEIYFRIYVKEERYIDEVVEKFVKFKKNIKFVNDYCVFD